MATNVGRELYIKNPMPDYASFVGKLKSSSGADDVSYIASADYTRLCREIRGFLQENVPHILQLYPPGSALAPASVKEHSDRDFSVYVGAGGNAYLHWKLSKFFAAEQNDDKSGFHLQKATEAIQVALSLLPRASSDGIAFYIGNAGIHALAAVIHYKQGDGSRAEKHIQQLLALLPHALHGSAADEVLYGRAGYLFSLLFVRRHVGEELQVVSGLPSAMRSVFDAVMESGKKNSGVKPPNTSSLQFSFYGTDYNGAAHGTAGILYMLLQFPEWCKEPANEPWIKQSLDRLLSFQLPSGNFASAADSRADKLVYWCHGAPGTVSMLYQAHKVYGEARFKQALDIALKTIWERGLLKKGFGTCHGISGNAYAFLTMYRHTGVEEYYYSALKMAECMWSEEVKQEVAGCWDPQRYRPGVPDFPYSLMEGLGGTICFHCDLLHPETAAFPGYDGDI